MDVDDDDEYMNAAAAHAAFVMTVSAASMHSTRATSIFIKLYPLREKKSDWALPIFCKVNPVTLK